MKTATLIPPCGGELISLLAEGEAVERLKDHASRLPSLQLTPRSVCDLELLATGAFSPLDRFMGRADYARVLDEMRLSRGHVFPIPVTLPVGPGASVRVGQEIALRDEGNRLLALMTIEEVYEWNVAEEARMLAAQGIIGVGDRKNPRTLGQRAEGQPWGSGSAAGKVTRLADRLNDLGMDASRLQDVDADPMVQGRGQAAATLPEVRLTPPTPTCAETGSAGLRPLGVRGPAVALGR